MCFFTSASLFLSALFSPPCVYKNIFQRIQWPSSGPWSDWLWFKTLFSSLLFSLSSLRIVFLISLRVALFTFCFLTWTYKHKHASLFFVVLFFSYLPTSGKENGEQNSWYGPIWILCCSDVSIMKLHKWKIYNSTNVALSAINVHNRGVCNLNIWQWVA